MDHREHVQKCIFTGRPKRQQGLRLVCVCIEGTPFCQMSLLRCGGCELYYLNQDDTRWMLFKERAAAAAAVLLLGCALLGYAPAA